MKLLENKGRLAGPYVLSVETAQRCLLHGKPVALALAVKALNLKYQRVLYVIITLIRVLPPKMVLIRAKTSKPG